MRYLLLTLLAILTFSCEYNSVDDLIPVEPVADDPVDPDDPVDMPMLVSHAAEVAPIFNSQCVSCHSGQFPSGGVAYGTYELNRAGVENGAVLDRIQRMAGDPQVMPLSGPMPQATIDIVVQWAADGYQQ